jgi:hypothetical protein
MLLLTQQFRQHVVKCERLVIGVHGRHDHSVMRR